MVQPRADRWHRQPVAQFGGIAVVLAFAAAAGLTPVHGRLLGVTAFTLLIAALGFCDDLRPWTPRTKLLVEAIIAAATVSLGVVYPLCAVDWVNVCFTIAWIVGITNAFNLLDNMDGLSAGISVIAAVILSLLAADAHLRVLTLIFAGAVAGFLVFNFKPARIFMGDTGSLAIGYYLACASILVTEHLGAGFSTVFLPVLVLFIPVFDTLLVSVTRRLNGRAISAGARDHTSHRLVMLGLRERSAVLVLYALAALSGMVAILSQRIWAELGWGVLGLFLLAASLFWFHLARLKLPNEYLSRTNVFVPALVARVSEWLFARALRPDVRPVCILVDGKTSQVSTYFAQMDSRFQLAEVVHLGDAAWSQQLLTAITRTKPAAIYCGPECEPGVRKYVAEVAEIYRLRCFEIDVEVREVSFDVPAQPPLKGAGMRVGH